MGWKVLQCFDTSITFKKPNNKQKKTYKYRKFIMKTIRLDKITDNIHHKDIKVRKQDCNISLVHKRKDINQNMSDA